MSDDMSGIADWLWIDYLEDELEPGLESDLQLLLLHSEEDRDTFEQIRTLRTWVKASDEIADWPLDERLNRARSHVLEAIQNISVAQTECETQETAHGSSAGNLDTKALSV